VPFFAVYSALWLLFLREYKYSITDTSIDDELVPIMTIVAESTISLPSMFLML
jgi:hypothetical protein